MLMNRYDHGMGGGRLCSFVIVRFGAQTHTHTHTHTNTQRIHGGYTLGSSYIASLTDVTQYKGQANLHVFEDWCGSSTDRLRRNLHYPLYPHSRTIVHKLAISPQWTNYGLRIFGYLHPYTDGEFVFALSSDDNSEFWLSTNDSPSNLQLLAWVGKTGSEWTAPGEFEKYASQISTATQLSAQKRYFFELIHKQNERGTDHVEVAWKLLDEDFRFVVIESKYISLYVNESSLLMSDVAHIPQTVASYRRRAPWNYSAVSADLLREDPRDTFHQVPLIGGDFLEGVLPDCSYKPSYTIKDFPLTRYQGLQFVHMSFIYPNDYTRLTHMEKDNSCFYPENPSYMKMFGFSRYMRLNGPDGLKKEKSTSDDSFQRRKSVLEDDKFGKDIYPNRMEVKMAHQRHNNLFSDYGDDYDDYVLKRRRKLFSTALSDSDTLKKSPDASRHESRLGRGVVPRQKKVAEPLHLVATQSSKQETPTAVKPQMAVKIAANVKPKRKQNSAKRPNLKSVEKTQQLKPPVIKKKLGTKHTNSTWLSVKMNQTHVQTNKKSLQAINAGAPKLAPTEDSKLRFMNSKRSNGDSKFDVKSSLVTAKQRYADNRKKYTEKVMEMPGLRDMEKNLKGKSAQKWSIASKDKVVPKREEIRRDRERDTDTLWGAGGDFDEEELTPAPGFDVKVDWNQTFHINHVDLQAMRSDWIDLHCNVSGNLLLHSRDALPIAKAFVTQLNEKNKHSPFTLVRVVNVEKRVDGVQGSRYLLELELKNAKGQLLRLSHYIYALIRNRARPRSQDLGFRRPKPQLVLCNPVGFYWNPVAMIHFIVPVKNQARWVQQLIDDMVALFKATGDANFNLIITDYNSTDMDVRAALKKSSLPRYRYVKLRGNFERSAGLQAGIDLIDDEHSIVFLCDLHIQFPPSIMDSIRKHCIEGFMAFAPIVMRLDCGATPSEGRGYWEVNGFGLLGIYKSDLDAVGGMNTKEFTNRWGGEDWELLDRILQAGLEVERLYLRNFFHHYHSKRGMWNRQVSPGER
ncbi:beta-1,4-N-acetylgalactosaminyltransferase 3 isoform X2 [Syngnathoides biaculeatus]|uniref:beta-1,4-N-acetylgalactosaminyltransferase 3 isoform X2 n=1 Tax=Syngnathoides biaculeatus TaxID=300417 RepID=UPI002ADE6367|nr:beta-1,4-N-acetylgalactosaminyltransferase 3 isoform X2 [Syngnathoides biaculeatus]